MPPNLNAFCSGQETVFVLSSRYYQSFI